jgi:hypothetical protein
MKPITRVLLTTLALTAWAAADLPKKAPITKYIGLWTNSPFTSKPPPPDPGPEVNPLEDYALSGVSPINGGYRVTMINKKKPEERITVDSGSDKTGFKILGVTRKPGNPLGTVVRMSSGTSTGTVAFDEKLLTLATAAPKQANPQATPQQVPTPGQLPAPGQGITRQPRPRVVPPPTVQPTAAPTQPTQNNRRGGR